MQKKGRCLFQYVGGTFGRSLIQRVGGASFNEWVIKKEAEPNIRGCGYQKGGGA